MHEIISRKNDSDISPGSLPTPDEMTTVVVATLLGTPGEMYPQ